MLLVIGWRGKPGVKDEPQHKKQEGYVKHVEIYGNRIRDNKKF